MELWSVRMRSVLRVIRPEGLQLPQRFLQVAKVARGRGQLVLAEQRQALTKHGQELLASMLPIPLAQQRVC